MAVKKYLLHYFGLWILPLLIFASPSSAATDNVAWQKATSSSSTAGGRASAQAVDGIVKANGSNRWQSDAVANHQSQWLEVSLGATYSIVSFDADLGRGGNQPSPPKAFVIQYDSGSGIFKSIPSTSTVGNTLTHVAFTLNNPVSAKKLRFVCTGAGDVCRVQEFRAYSQNTVIAPIITSSTAASATVGVPFSYSITASNTPTQFGATGLPAGLSLNASTGVISGSPSVAAVSTINVSATNSAGTGTANLVLTVAVDTSGRSPSQFGAWGITKNPLQKNIEPMKDAIQGMHVSGDWSEIELSPGQYDWDSFDEMFRVLIDDNNLLVGFDVLVGPNSPEWIYCLEDGAGKAIKTPTCVPRVHVSGQSADQSSFYPYYLDPYYTQRYSNLLNQVALHISTTFSQNWKDHILYWQSAEGSTGDTGAYKGEPLDSKYVISDATWNTYKYSIWLGMDASNKLLNPYLQLLINPGNDGANYEWGLDNIPCAWTKSGNSSHQYSFNGEINEINRYAPLSGSASSCNRIRGEFQDVYGSVTWNKSPKANTYAITLSALTLGVDMFNLTGASVDPETNTSDLTLYDTFNKFAGIRQASSSDKAFIYFRDVPDMMDLIRFPENIYGPLYNDPVGFGKAVDRINADVTTGASEKAEKITDKKVDFFNLNRADAIKNAAVFKNNPAILNKPKFVSFDDSDIYGNADGYAIYDHDFGIDVLPDNYGKFMKQLNPNATSIGQWRIGSDKVNNTRYGRYARSFDTANGKSEMIFDIDDAIDQSAQVKNLRVSVTYYDQGGYAWALNYATGAAGNPAALSVTNGNTNTWKTLTWVLPNVNFMNKYKSGDLSVSYLSGGNTVFGMIEVQTTTDAATVAK